MRGFGMVLLGLGITLLIPAGFAIGCAKNLDEVVGFLACTAAIPVPMIVAGIALVRRAEDRLAPPSGADSAAEWPPDPAGLLARVGAFDLNRLNWAGWLLLLATFAFVLAEAGALVWLVGKGPWANGPPRIIGLPMVLLAVGFFVALRGLLRLLGVAVYRR